MAESNFRGPVTSMGSLEVEAGTSFQIQPFDGPSLFYQNTGVPDLRSPLAKDGTAPGRQPAFLAMMDVFGVDAIPQTNASNTVAAAQVITASVAMALATVGVNGGSASAQSMAVLVPIVPQGTTVITNAAIALDFGFTTGTTAANSSTVVVVANNLFSLGQWIIIGNAGNSAATRSHICQVVAISTSNTTTINISPVAGTVILNAPIGQANLYGSDLLPPGSQFGPATASASAHNLGGRIQAGFGRFMNPREMLARGLSVQCDTLVAGTGTLLVSGYDVWGQSMTELLTATGTTPAYGKKAFKYITSVVPQTIGTTVSASYSVGVSDMFGAPFRFDEIEHLQTWAGGTAISNSVGYSTAVTTPATNTSGDVRGVVQISAIGPGTSISAPSTTNNVKRLVIIQNIGVWNTLFATPNNLSPMFGTTQA